VVGSVDVAGVLVFVGLAQDDHGVLVLEEVLLVDVEVLAGVDVTVAVAVARLLINRRHRKPSKPRILKLTNQRTRSIRREFDVKLTKKSALYEVQKMCGFACKP
jgi:hypothetical protein